MRASYIIPSRSLDAFLLEAVVSIVADAGDRAKIVVVIDGPCNDEAIRDQVLSGKSCHPWQGLRDSHGVERRRPLCQREFDLRLDADDLSMPGRHEALTRLFLHDESGPGAGRKFGGNDPRGWLEIGA